ncbi:MAG: hypothetical protein ACOWYE_15980 [Desulfatiglandales bacterium]
MKTAHGLLIYRPKTMAAGNVSRSGEKIKEGFGEQSGHPITTPKNA